MTVNFVRKRQGKKRCLAAIFDAIFPDVQVNTPVFASLIMFCKLILADGRIHPRKSRLLNRLAAPEVKLRRDDVEFICGLIETRGMTGQQLDWLVMFIQSSITPQSSRELAHALERLAMPADKLHAVELHAISRARALLGLDTSKQHAMA